MATDTLAVDVGRCGQGGKSKYPDYAEHLQKSLFVLAPRGSYPATFMLGEAVQAGALAVYVYEAHMIRGKRLGGKRVKGGFRRAPAATRPTCPTRRSRRSCPTRTWACAGATSGPSLPTTKLKSRRRGSRRSPRPTFGGGSGRRRGSGRCLPPTARASTSGWSVEPREGGRAATVL